MAKRRRGAREQITPESILDYFATIGAAPQVRLVALALYHSINGKDPTLEYLAWRTGMTTKQLISYPLKTLRQLGILTEVNGRMKFNLPDFEPPRKKEKNKFESKLSLTESSKIVLEDYKRLWSAHYQGYCVVTGQDRSRAAHLIKELGLEEVRARLLRYMNHKDKWLVERSHPFMVFAKTVNSYCGRSNAKNTAKIIQHGSEFEAEVRRFEEAERRT